MSSFSERYGYTEARSVLQVESMDQPLRNSLWNAVSIAFSKSSRIPANRSTLFLDIWADVFRQPMDLVPSSYAEAVIRVRNHFMTCKWYEVYDFVEYIVNRFASLEIRDVANAYMEREKAGYRFVNRVIVPITDQREIEEIESASRSASKPVATHLDRAVALLADRENPDYRNSVKESISAVESAVNALNKSKDALGQALKKLNPPLPLAFQKGLSTIYGYTSDSNGIRHALLDESTVDGAEARFMLIACSAFVNFLRDRGGAALP